jgi:hypothetical protein
MLLYLTCAVYLAIAANAGLLIGYLFGHKRGRKLGRWDGIEEGYADAMRDGWLRTSRTTGNAVYNETEGS